MKCDYNSMLIIIIIILFLTLFYSYSKKENFNTVNETYFSLNISKLGNDGEAVGAVLTKKVALDKEIFN